MGRREHLNGMAFHEAGHAVVAWALNVAVGDIHVRKVGEGDGGTQIGCADALPFIDRLALCFAGIQAETVFDVPQPPGMGDGDICVVLNLLKGLPDRHGKVLRDKGRDRARDLLLEHRDRVIRLAERLNDVHQVGGAEFLSLMGA